MNFPVQLRTTLSHASPDKAAEIRSAVTGALKYSKNGMFGFERSVETTFVLPWDLDPCVEPQKLTRPVRDGIRSQLLEESEYASNMHFMTTATYDIQKTTPISHMSNQLISFVYTAGWFI